MGNVKDPKNIEDNVERKIECQVIKKAALKQNLITPHWLKKTSDTRSSSSSVPLLV